MSDKIARTVRLVIIDDDQKQRNALKQALALKDIRVVGESDSLKSGTRLLRGLEPEVALIQLPPDASATLEAVRRLRDEIPTMAIIFTTSEMSAELILTGIRSGAQEFLARPVDPVELQRALDQVERNRVKIAAATRRRGSTVSIFSTKGGVGATSVAVNLAVSLAQDERRTVIVDMNAQLGDVALQLDCKPRYSLVDALGEGGFDEQQLQSVMGQHASGLFVLNLVNRTEDADQITAKHVSEMMSMLNTMFDSVVIDLGRHLDERTVEAADLSDRLLLVTELSLSAVRNCAQYLELFRRLEVDTGKMSIVVNRYHRKYPFSVDDLEKTVGVKSYWEIPNEFKPMSDAVANGVPVVISAPRTKVAKNIKELQESLQTARPFVEEPATDVEEVVTT